MTRYEPKTRICWLCPLVAMILIGMIALYCAGDLQAPLRSIENGLKLLDAIVVVGDHGGD